MSYAIRNDLQGWRAIDSADDVLEDEYYSDDPVDIGPAVTVPNSVTMRQARLALHAAGLLAGVEAALDALPEPPRTSARIEWDYSSEVYRNKPFVVMLGQALDLTDEQIDDLFITAATL